MGGHDGAYLNALRTSRRGDRSDRGADLITKAPPVVHEVRSQSCAGSFMSSGSCSTYDLPGRRAAPRRVEMLIHSRT